MRATTQPGIEDLYREHALGLVRLALLLTDPGRVLAYLRTAVVNGSSSRYRRHLVARRLRPESLAMVQSAEALVLAGEDRRAEYVDTIPPVFETRVLSLRGFDKDGMMADAMLTQPGEADAGIRRLLANPEIETIHAHNATRGCFSARIERN